MTPKTEVVAGTTGATRGATDDEVFDNAEAYRRMVCEREGVEFVPRHRPRKDLPPMPARIKRLPLDRRGYPVPWFVQWVAGEPDFRILDGEKLLTVVKGERRCWTCGQPLGRYMAFVIGPMCVVNRVSAEPPSHQDCAVFAAQACPFLTRPKAIRREANMPEGVTEPAGLMIPRNPGVALVWTTRRYALIDTGKGAGSTRYVFNIGEPAGRILAFAEGREATKAELAASVESGLPLLEQACALEATEQDQADARKDLVRQVTVARQLLHIAV